MISTLNRLIKVGNQTKKVINLCILYTIIGLLSIITTGAIGSITQHTLAFDSQSMRNGVLVLIVASVLETLITWISNVQKVTMKQSLLVAFKDKTAQSILKSEFSYSQSLEKGDIIGRLSSDLSSIATASEMSITIIRSTILLVITLIGMAYFDMRLMAAFAITIPLYFLVGWFIVAKSTGNIVPWKNAMGETNALIQELLSNRSTIKAFTLKFTTLGWLKDALNKSASLGIRGISKLYLMNLPQLVMMNLPYFLIAIVGVYAASTNTLSVSALVSTFLLAQIAYGLLSDISNSTQNIPQLLASTQRIFPIWDTPSEPSGTALPTNTQSQPIIQFDNVTFSYPTSPETTILNKLSFTLFEGEHIGLVGTSGSGKSTIFKLLSGLYTPSSGCIRVYGVDINDWDKTHLRNTLSIISQNTYLFEDTLFSNLQIACPSLNEAQALKALKAVNLEAFVQTLPDGLMSNLGEKGSKLSGGQRQRISIARSILKDSPIVLYDEVTSALDAESEQAIDQLIMSNKKTKTQLIIAHRFSTIKDMDRILVLDKGRVVEEGTHTSLIKNNALYKKLYTKQGDLTHE